MSNATRATNNPQDSNFHSKTTKITIIGAGWAGLTCAYELLKAGYANVNIIEAAPQAGGRARGVNFGKLTIDNGQHLLIRGYEHTLQLLQEIDPNYLENFRENPFEILSKNSNKLFHFKLINNNFLPHLLNLLLSVLLTKSFTLTDKIRLLRFSISMMHLQFSIKEDMSVENLLNKYQLSSDIIQKFFAPIVVSTMTTPISSASAQVFLNILKITFFTKRHNSNLLFATTDLTTLFVTPLVDKIISLGGKIEYNKLINNISIEKTTHNPHHIYTHSNKQQSNVETDILILATPPWQASKLINQIPQLINLRAQLDKFTFEPITSIYLELAQPLDLEKPMVGLIGNHAHWIFEHSAGNKNIASIVISSQDHRLNRSQLPKEQIAQQVIEEIKQIYAITQIINIKYIQEKRAAFSCNVLANQTRPSKTTIFPNIFLAGDYTTSGYPSTLEGAVLSGKIVAKIIDR